LATKNHLKEQTDSAKTKSDKLQIQTIEDLPHPIAPAVSQNVVEK
jgi:hypothetical protein